MPELNDLSSISGKLNAKFGANSCRLGTSAPSDAFRLPTGIFALTYATGGGFPVNQISILKGPESGGKTSTAISTMSMVPRICWRCFNTVKKCTCSLPAQKMKSVWIDVEGRFNKFWAQSIGCSPEDYYLINPEDGNQAGDQAKAALDADDCGLVVIDSVAALVPSEMMDASLDDKFIATQARLISDIVKRLTSKLNREIKREHPCVVLLINQMRANIGVFYGPTTVMAGGWSLKYFNGMNINITKKALQDKDKYYDKENNLFLAQKHAFSVDKFSSLKFSESGEFIRAIADIPDLGYLRGDIIDHKLVLSELLKQGLMIKKGTANYSFDGKSGAQKDFVELWKKNKDLYLDVQLALINHIRNAILSRGESNEGEAECLPASVHPVKKK